MTPVEEVHLNLYKVPMELVVVFQQVVEGTDVTMIGESKVLDASCLTLLQQEFQQSIVEESLVQGVHAAIANAVQQVVVDVVDLQPFEGLLVHALRLAEAPQTSVLVGHLGGDKEFVARMAAQRIAREHL